MPGYKVCLTIFEDSKTVYDRHRCSACDLLLRDPVQPSPCGHLLCESCADEILERHPAECPAAHCGEGYEKQDGLWVSAYCREPSRAAERVAAMKRERSALGRDLCNYL